MVVALNCKWLVDSNIIPSTTSNLVNKAHTKLVLGRTDQGEANMNVLMYIKQQEIQLSNDLDQSVHKFL